MYSIEETNNDRKIITSSSVFGILFDQLKKNIGENRVKSFLFHFGWEMGVKDGKKALKKNLPIEAMIKYGPRLHIKNGHISGINHQCRVQLNRDKKVISVLGQGVWLDSYEAREYRKMQGLSNTPVCHTLTGYASGYMSTILKKTLLAKELTCVGCGDKECSWVIKTIEQWENDKEEDLNLFKRQTIINELSYTYDQLLEQRKFLEELADFQKQLTEKIASGSDLKKLADKAFEIINIPIIIENTESEKITYTGLTEEQYEVLTNDMEQSMKEGTLRQKNYKGRFKGKTITTEIQKRLVTPIIVQKRVIGYCYFVYDVYDRSVEKSFEKDFILLDRFSNAVSLVLLNEKTEFESFERMKGNFLEKIIDGSLPKNEIIKRGNFIGIDLTKPFYIMMIDYKYNENSIEEEFKLYEQIYEYTTRYFNKKNLNVLVGHDDSKLIAYITADNFDNQHIHKLMTDFYTYLKSQLQKIQIFIGISDVGKDIQNINKYVEEAHTSLGLGNNDNVTFFNDLGILGILISSKNKKAIRLLAEKELSPIFNSKNADELLKTLYYYLRNGRKLEQTTIDLSLSIGGLRHRIRKIEELLKKDLRDADVCHELLLVIQSLIALGEWNVK
ncbi:PucR family transcriptional regulator [Aliibacillus thermotolerans]|nr:PucR family transcriptional regulator [Aliibacillus thermotolerans]